jgi:hypothetical protein
MPTIDQRGADEDVMKAMFSKLNMLNISRRIAASRFSNREAFQEAEIDGFEILVGGKTTQERHAGRFKRRFPKSWRYPQEAARAVASPDQTGWRCDI